MLFISTSLTVPGQPSPRFHVEAWLHFRNRGKRAFLILLQIKTTIFDINEGAAVT